MRGFIRGALFPGLFLPPNQTILILPQWFYLWPTENKCKILKSKFTLTGRRESPGMFYLGIGNWRWQFPLALLNSHALQFIYFTVKKLGIYIFFQQSPMHFCKKPKKKKKIPSFNQIKKRWALFLQGGLCHLCCQRQGEHEGNEGFWK